MRKLVGLGMAAALATACGTTVPLAQRGAGGNADSLGTTGGQQGVAPATQLTNGTSPVGAAAQTGSGQTPTQQGASGTTGASAGVPTLVANGPGVTATTITIGVTYYQSAQAANAAMGANNIDQTDPIAGTRAIINAINSRGGVAGRKLIPLLYSADPQSTQSYATMAQAACTYFTQDHKVFAVIDGTPALDQAACLARKGVALLGASITTGQVQPNVVDAYTATLARAHAVLVPALLKQGWFTPWDRLQGQPGTTRAKVGIVTVASPDVDFDTDHVLLPALARAGYAPAAADVIRLTKPGGFDDDGSVVAAVQSAALRFNADGVDHVLLVDANGSLSLLFHNYAFSQNYFPRYGGTSGNAWQVLLTAHDMQAKTLNGAMGIGWQPLFDLPYSDGDGVDSNAARHHCFQVFSQAGQPHTDASTAGGQAEACDVTFLLQAAFRGWTGPLTLSTFLARVAALGSSYPLSSGFSSHFTTSQHDGAGAFRAMAFDSSCGCMKYVGGVTPL